MAGKPGCGGKPGRSGAPKGNVNALRTGKNIGKKRLIRAVGEFPIISVKREGRAYMRALEDATIASKGTISLTDSHLIDTASAAVVQAGICRWLLRNKIKDMSPSDIRGCTADIVKAKERRDAAVRLLKLDVKPEVKSLSAYVIDSKERKA